MPFRPRGLHYLWKGRERDRGKGKENVKGKMREDEESTAL